MKARGLIFAAALLLIAGLSPASARVITQVGGCPNGNTWLVVITIDDKTGRITRLEGVDCQGIIWQQRFTIAPASTPPSLIGRYFEMLGEGAWIRYDVNETGVPTVMWGLDRTGLYWELSTPMLE